MAARHYTPAVWAAALNADIQQYAKLEKGVALRRRGAFLVCTFWLAQAFAIIGEIDRAKEVFSRAIAFANDVGLLSEEGDPPTCELLRQFSAGVQPCRRRQRRVGYFASSGVARSCLSDRRKIMNPLHLRRDASRPATPRRA